MLKLKLQYFGHLMRRVDSLEKTLMLGGIEGMRRRGWQRMRRLDGTQSPKAAPRGPKEPRHWTRAGRRLKAQHEGALPTRASSAKTRGFHTQLDEGPETPCW